MSKPRVIISTDIGGADPDDDQSMVHALLYADKLDIEAIISTPTKHGGRASDIHQVIDAYSKDYGNLKTWSSDYPTPDYLKSVVYQGNINVAPSAGYSSATAGSNAIIKAAKTASPSDPVWVLTWGAMTDLAQALHDDPSIKSNIKVYSIGAWNDQQDPHARNYVYNNHKDLWWIENDSTFRGMYVDSTGAEKNAWKMGDAQGHGALGDFFHQARPWGLKMGDTPSLLYLLDNANNLTPSASSWGGAFKQNGHGPNYWTDNPDSSLRDGSYNGSETVRVHQKAFYEEFAQRLDRAKSPNGGSNADNPVIANNDTAATDRDKAVVVKVLANDSAADGGLKLASADAASAKGGKVVMNSDGTVTYTPKAGYTGSDTFKYVAKDADGDTKAATVTVTVKAPASSSPPTTGINNPVVAVDDKYTMDAGKKLYFNTSHILLNDKGADGGLKATVAAKSANGVTLEKWADGTIVYKAGAASGSDRIDYVLTDKDGSKDTASVLITVKNGIAAPTAPPAAKAPAESANPPSQNGKAVANNDSYNVDAGTTLYFNTRFLTWNDKGDGALKANVVAKSANGVTLEKWADGTVVYKAGAASGSDRIDYVLTDKNGSTDTASVIVTIKNGVAAPAAPSAAKAPAESAKASQQNGKVVAVDDSYKVDAGTTLYFNTRFLTWNDKGDGALNVASVDAVSDRGVKISWGAEGTDKDGTLIYKAPAGFHGVDKIDYKVVDAKGGYDIGTVLIHVNDLN
jgi:hypothetical protein